MTTKYTDMLRTNKLLLMKTIINISILLLPILIYTQENKYPASLLTKEEMMPRWEITDGSFTISKRNFILCRGKKFQSEPPSTPGFSITKNKIKYKSAGKFNNAIIAKLKIADISETTKFKQAILQLQKGLRFDHEFWPFLFNMARIQLILKNYKQANYYFTKAVKVMPLYSRGHYYLGLVKIKFNRSVSAKFHLKKAYLLNKNDDSALIAMGDYYLLQNSFEHARKRYLKVQNLFPKSESGVLGLVRLDIKQNKVNKARLRLQEWADERYIQNPNAIKNNILLQFYLGHLNYKLRDYKRAKSHFNEVLKTPSHELFLKVSKNVIQKMIKQIEQK